MTIKENSLLEIAVELLKKKRKPCQINAIIKEVMSIKGIKASQVKEHAPQFLMDFMLSGYFVYCGDDTWDLKERQPTSVLDKDGTDYEDILNDDEDVKNNELKDGVFVNPEFENENGYELISEEDDEDEEEVEEDDIERELEGSSGSEELIDIDEYEEDDSE